jgi:hypothetical protein
MFEDFTSESDYSISEKINNYTIALPIEETYPESTGSIFSIKYANQELDIANDSTDLDAIILVDVQSSEAFSVSVDSNKINDEDYQLDIYYYPQFLTVDYEKSGININLEVTLSANDSAVQFNLGYNLQKGITSNIPLIIDNFFSLNLKSYKLTVFGGYHKVDILSFVLSRSLDEVLVKAKKLASSAELKSVVVININDIG